MDWLLRGAGDLGEVFGGIDAGVVAVFPKELEAVAADRDPTPQPVGGGSEGLGNGAVGVAHDVLFTGTTRAGAGSAKGFESEELLGAVRPLDGEFVADALDILRNHLEKVGGPSGIDQNRPEAARECGPAPKLDGLCAVVRGGGLDLPGERVGRGHDGPLWPHEFPPDAAGDRPEAGGAEPGAAWDL
jgi:hypothetical protein